MPLSQIIGGGTSTVAEIEATHALRGTIRPLDPGSLGVYHVGGVSGTMAAGIGTQIPVFGFQWTSPTIICCLRRVLLTAATQSAFTAGAAFLSMQISRFFPSPYTGGTSLIPSGNMNKLRTSFAASAVGDIRIATTGTLTIPANSPTFDKFYAARVPLAAPATAGKTMTGQDLYYGTDNQAHVMFEARPGEYPFRFGQNEGFNVVTSSANAFPLVGTWVFAVTVQWEERTGWY